MRKIITTLIGAIYLMAMPPFNRVYNRTGFLFGLPVFFVGLLAISMGMVLSTFLLYCWEECRGKDEDLS